MAGGEERVESGPVECGSRSSGERLTPPSARKYCYLDRAFRARSMLENAMQRPGRDAYDLCLEPSAATEKSATARAQIFLTLLLRLASYLSFFFFFFFRTESRVVREQRVEV